ncbi:MAG: hypothetical protein ACXWQE_14975 [Bdellovibrionales bacterium]
MKLFALSLLFTCGLNAMASTVALSPDNLECRTLTGPTFNHGDVGTATALFYENQIIYHGYWVTTVPNALADMIRCKSLISKAKAAKKELLLDLELAAEGNSPDIAAYGFEADSHWRKDDFLYIEGTIPTPKCTQ